MAVPLTLKVFKGDALVATKDYERDIIKIGRLSSAHLCLDDEKVSRIHSVIEVGGDGSLSIIDMGSVEGTYVNGKRVNKGQLAFGDEIRLGATTIVVEDPAAFAAKNLSVAAESNAEVSDGAAPAPAVDAPVAALAEGLANAAGVSHEPAISVQRVGAPLDASVASTEKNAIVAPAPAAAVQAPAAAPVRRVRPAARKATGPQGLAVRLSWGDQRVGDYVLAPDLKHVFTVGSADATS